MREADPRACSGCGFPVGACECDSLRATPYRYETKPSTPSDPPEEFAGRYVTEAIESTVREDGEEIGHVALLDLDGVALGHAVESAHRLPGPAAVLRSSTEGYHIWSLAIDSLDSWHEQIERLSIADPEHLALSEERGCGVLRIDGKIDMETGDEIKPAPSLSRLVPGSTDLPLSRPHARILRDEFGLDVEDGRLCDREFRGDGTERRVYMAEIGGR